MVVFYLSSEFVRDTVITNEQGQIIYKTNTPFRFGTRTTTIYKAKRNANRSNMRDQFNVIGEIEWHSFSSSKFRIGGTEVAAKDFIPKRGFSGRKRVFTGPDGRCYCWEPEFGQVVLSRDDAFRTEVARSHRATLGIIGKKRKASLEVSPEVVDMMDTVIMTFIYVQSLNTDSQRTANSANSANMAAAAAAGATAAANAVAAANVAAAASFAPASC